MPIPEAPRVTRRRFIDTLASVPVAVAVPGRAPHLPQAQSRGRGAPTSDLGVMAVGAHAARQASVAPGPPADLPRSVAPSRADLGSNFEVVHALSTQTGRSTGPYAGSFLSGRFASLDAFTTQGRASILEAYGYCPPPVDPSPEVVDRYEGPDFIREKVVFSTTPSFRVPAYVHIPKGRSGRAPAIIDLHSHGGMFLFGKEKVIDFGRNHPAMTTYHAGNYESRPTATALVKRGYVVITIDAFMFGERRVMMDADLSAGWERSAYTADDVQRLNQVCRGKESTLAKTLTVLGISWPGIVAWDDMRTVDYLISRPEVDPARVGCVGVSFGGWRSLFLSALDTRIKAGCVVGFMSTIQSMLRSHVDTHSWIHFVPGLHRHLDLPDVVSLNAPRPLLVQQCRRDGLFPLDGMESSVKTIADVYARAGIADRFTSRFYDVPHQFNVQMQEDAFAWFDAHLRPPR